MNIHLIHHMRKRPQLQFPKKAPPHLVALISHSADSNPGSFAPLWFPMIAILQFNEKCHMHKFHFPISTFEDSPTTLDPPTAATSCLTHWSHFMSHANYLLLSVVSFLVLFFFPHHNVVGGITERGVSLSALTTCTWQTNKGQGVKT